MNNLRYSTFWFDFQGDGRFSKERIKKKDKRFLRKWTSRKKYSNWIKGRYKDENW